MEGDAVEDEEEDEVEASRAADPERLRMYLFAFSLESCRPLYDRTINVVHPRTHVIRCPHLVPSPRNSKVKLRVATHPLSPPSLSCLIFSRPP